MIAVCPKCKARYRVDAAQIAPSGAKLRCSQCSAVFLVRATEAVRPPVVAATGGAPWVGAPSPAAPPSAEEPVRSGRLVVVADPNAARGKTSVDALQRWGLAAHLVHDGVEAMLAIQRMLPQAVVLDAALPRMSGLQVCEVVKRNASLKTIHVVLIGVVHDPSRERHDPADLYGADVSLEQPDLPDGLRPILEQCGLVARTAPARAPEAPTAPVVSSPAPPPRTAPTPASTPVPAPVASSTSASDPARDEERERARRLARIAVSEMVLYQPEKFARASRDGTLERALEVEIQEARALIRQRIGPEVRAEADFVLEELHRVARERGGRA